MHDDRKSSWFRCCGAAFCRVRDFHRELGAGFKLCKSSPQSQPVKIKAAAIEVQMIQSDEIKFPAESQIALYENLIRQLPKQGFSQVYREGDRNASVNDLVVGCRRHIHYGSLPIFEAGRSVTSRAGRERQGPFLWWESQSHFDFAKKAAHVTHETFS